VAVPRGGPEKDVGTGCALPTGPRAVGATVGGSVPMGGPEKDVGTGCAPGVAVGGEGVSVPRGGCASPTGGCALGAGGGVVDGRTALAGASWVAGVSLDARVGGATTVGASSGALQAAGPRLDSSSRVRTMNVGSYLRIKPDASMAAILPHLTGRLQYARSPANRACFRSFQTRQEFETLPRKPGASEILGAAVGRRRDFQSRGTVQRDQRDWKSRLQVMVA